MRRMIGLMLAVCLAAAGCASEREKRLRKAEDMHRKVKEGNYEPEDWHHVDKVN